MGSTQVTNFTTVTHEYSHSGKLMKRATVLTTREIEVLRLTAEGKSQTEIAEQLFLSRKTVDTHRTNIYRKISAHSTYDLFMYAIKNHIIACPHCDANRYYGS